ncbi:MAG: prepilin-type N-terminal cleavage/methylation domain-containing protein [Patescibacteria group bacterium]
MFHPISKQLGVKSKLTGFTLIELLVVTVILGVLAAISLRSFQSSQIKSRDARRKEDLATISQALEAYYNDKGGYPTGVGGQIVGCTSQTPVACVWGQPFQDYRETFYMAQLPEDPKNFNYFYVSSGGQYQLYARLENMQDQSIPQVGGNPAIYTGTLCGTGVLCNYGIASTNSQLAGAEEE